MTNSTSGSKTGLAEISDSNEAMRALFHPKRIAIVGATERRGFAANIHRAILRQGFEGEIFGVTPKYDEVLGAKCYPTIDAIPGGVDCALIVVPSHLVLSVLEACPTAGVKAVVIITSGFGEQTDDEALQRQEQVRAFVQRTGIRVVGPNCLGLVSTPGKLYAKSGPYKTVKPGPIGLVFQSGLLTFSMIMPTVERQFGYSYVVTTGNEADLEAADFIEYYAHDEQTRIIACMIEQFRDPEKLRRAASVALEQGKPIIALKIGRSEGGQRAARAHTGSLVGSDEIADALMRQLGIIRVESLDELTETIAAFHTKRLPKGDGVGSMFMSGGAAGLVSDIADSLGLRLPDLTPETVQKLKGVIPEYGNIGNPLDTTGQAASEPEITGGSIEALAEDPNIDIVINGQPYPSMFDLGTPVGKVVRTMPDRYPDKVFLMMSLVTGNMHDGSRPNQPVEEPVSDWDGVPFLQGTEHGLKAVRSLIRYAEFRKHREAGNRLISQPSAMAAKARAIVSESGGQPLTERAAKTLLSLYDIPVTREILAQNVVEAVAAADEIGYPVVMKIESPDILHKTESGGIALGVSDESQLRREWDTILSNVRRYNDAARINGILVQEMAPNGRELILGMSQDPSFGPAIAVGLGGIFVEVLKDVALGVPPIDDRAARDMLGRLRGKAILEDQGSRGQGEADIDELIRIMKQFSQLCVDLDDCISEIDINPLLLYGAGSGAKVVDCLIVPNTE